MSSNDDAKFKVFISSENMEGAISHYIRFCKNYGVKPFPADCDLSGNLPNFCFGFDNEDLAILFKLSHT